MSPSESPTLFILASTSPRRRELVQLLGMRWHRLDADVDETVVDDPDPGDNVVKTAALKAGAVAGKAPPDAVILAADTAVVVDGEMLGKPADAAEARQMLRRLRGRTHQVYTGIVVVNRAADRVIADLAVVDVPMRAYGDEEIEAYIATGDPFDKAGAYGIQHPGFRPVADLSGCYAAVVGLPLCHLTRTLRAAGIDLAVDVAAACQAHHDYRCPIFAEVLAGTAVSGVTDADLAQYLRPVTSRRRTSQDEEGLSMESMNIELQKAIAAARAGRRDQARTLVDNVLAAEPDNAHAWFLNSILASEEAEQVSSLTKVLELEPNHEVAQKRLAELRAAGAATPEPSMGDEPAEPYEEPSPSEFVEAEPAEMGENAPPTVFDEAEPVTLPADTADADDWEEEGEPILATPGEPADFDDQADGDSVPAWLAEEGGYLPTEPALVVDEQDLVEEDKGDELPDWLQEEPADDWLQEDEIELPFTNLTDDEIFDEAIGLPEDGEEVAIAAAAADATTPRPVARKKARSKLGGLELLLIVLTLLAVLVVAALVYVIITSPV